MIKINFNGHVTEPKHRKLIREASNFFANDLLSKRKLDNTFIEIRFVKFKSNELGYCRIHDDEENEHYPTSFSIDMNSGLNIKNTIETLAHEMVHLRQFRNGELKYRKRYTRFRGCAYCITTPYDKEPWEKEAYKLEPQLVKKFAKYISQLNKELYNGD